ncbi:MAG TPA: sigma-70 family RNA polymerase sigma factor [Actinomycetota bacterium]
MEGRPLEEAELVGRARAGDAAAYEELVRMHQQIAMRTAWLVTRNATEAEDAVQEGFVKAYRALDRFREGAAFRPWLLTIVANEARNRRRSVARADRLALRVAEVRPSGDAAPSPEAAALLDEERTMLVEALNALREEDRLVVGYRFLLGLSEAETAAALGVPMGTVKSRLSRALVRLRSTLSETDVAASGGGTDG